MKYKVGDEVLMKAEITKVYDTGVIIKVGGLCEAFFANENIEVNKTYEQGLADAWELAKKIGYEPKKGGFSNAELMEIFGTAIIEGIYDRFTVEEALAKIESYEKENEIKVGNEVRCGNVYGVVTYSKNGYASVMWKDGSIGDECECKDLTKTGKHIDIESLLRQIGE